MPAQPEKCLSQAEDGILESERTPSSQAGKSPGVEAFKRASRGRPFSIDGRHCGQEDLADVVWASRMGRGSKTTWRERILPFATWYQALTRTLAPEMMRL